ncbi:alkaline phosphatase D family protein [Luteolibacter arcticus]|uniref:Alkaline phosphatase D family protein n=1 Tax=Luteolibacter arcticus TaxID=1581411 RepID=A0ABT3GP11_9BACT|nr:alkaline phosphatase D family protein [Luteolibacter arcticus]MCW1925242.1 alkaline phosphatase D family protein [Luteolibacter arcticus]
MKPQMFRRMIAALVLASSGLASAQHPFRIQDLYEPALAPFYHGVASGDPVNDGFIIWTRVTPKPTGNLNFHRKVPVKWIVASDPLLTQVVAQGNQFALAASDFTVKVDVRGLAAGQTYYYGFEALGRESITGKAKTAPDVAVDQLKFAVVSCANYEWGYFSGYEQISRRTDLDAVICVGDYLYEYPDNDSYSSEEIRDERVLFPRNETVTLKHYRTRYANYRLDPNLRRAHQQHPFIAIWDDHEFANNAWRGGAENHNLRKEGSWKRREAAAIRAFLEWMPIREQGTSIYRTLNYGPLMDLILIDTRIEGRDPQIEDVNEPLLYAPSRTMLGRPQKDWLKTEMSDSAATWKVIGNQVVFSEFNIGFTAPLDPLVTSDFLESQFLDIWDGYPAERRELVNYIADQDLDNVVILTGDIHCSFAFEVADPVLGNPFYDPATGAGAVAVEFVTPSLSAANFDEELGEFFTGQLEEVINSPFGGFNYNPHMKYADLDQHGYVVLSVSPSAVQADYYFLADVLVPVTTESWGAGFTVDAGSTLLVPATSPAPAKPVQDIPAP